MDPFPDVVHALVFPTAIEYPDFPAQAARRGTLSVRYRDSERRLNDKGLSDSCLDVVTPASRSNHALVVPEQPCWSIDGAEPDGCHFWTIPSFARYAPPLKIDVYVGGISLCDTNDKAKLNPQLDLLYQLGVHRMPLVETKAIKDLLVAKHICTALQYWSGKITNFEQKYFGLPFGSYIAIEQLEEDPRQMKCELVPDHSLEGRWLTTERLRELWPVPAENWPVCLDHRSLRYVRRIGDSVFLVETVDPNTERIGTYIFKSITFDIKFLYHELRLLLSMPEHPNIQGRPVHIVVKRVRFGGKKGVCGFTLPYLPMGSMLEYLRNQGLLVDNITRQRISWSRQIIKAMLHVRKSEIGYYSDLRASNVMLRPSIKGDVESDVVLIDFEQRTPWYTEAPPEIFWINVLERLAYGPVGGTLQKDCQEFLLRMNPNIRCVSRTDVYNERFAGSTAFMYLNTIEREKAVVFMIGKLIWRIFEGASRSLDLISVEDLSGSSGILFFPQFDATPAQIRPLIGQCVGRPSEWTPESQRFTVQNDQFVLPLSTMDKLDDCEFVQTLQGEARSWWMREVDKAKRYCSLRCGGDGIEASEMTGASQRPSLDELLDRFDNLTANL